MAASKRRIIEVVFDSTNCTQCCGGGGSPGVSFTCVSREGNGNLRGWSKFQNENSGDWNTRKYTRLDVSGQEMMCYFSDFACANNSSSADGGFIFSNCVSLCNTATGSFSHSGTIYNSDTITTPPPCVSPGIHPTVPVFKAWDGTIAVYAFNNDSFDGAQIADTDTSRTYTGLETCYSRANIFSPYAFKNGEVAFGVSIPDTVFDALGRGTPTIGTNCRSTDGTIGSTTARSTTQLAVTGARAVRATLACTGLTDSEDYEITVDLDRYTSDTSTYIDTIQVVIPFTAAGTSEDIEYDLPIDSTYDYEITDATIAAA